MYKYILILKDKMQIFTHKHYLKNPHNSKLITFPPYPDAVLHMLSGSLASYPAYLPSYLGSLPYQDWILSLTSL